MKRILFTVWMLLITWSLMAQWQRINLNTLDTESSKGFKLIDDSSFVLLNVTEVIVGRIRTQSYQDGIEHSEYQLDVPVDHVVQKVFFLDTTEVWFTTQKEGKDYLFHSEGFVSSTQIDFSDSLVSRISGIHIWENGKGVLICQGDYSKDNHYIYTTENYGAIWRLSTEKVGVSHQNLKAYVDGGVFIYDGFEGFGYSSDFGETWVTYSAKDFEDISIRNYLPDNRIFNEPFLDEGVFYVVGDYGYYTTHRNVLYKLDVYEMSILALNSNEMYDSHCFFFSEDEFYFDANDYGSEEEYSGPTVYRDSTYYPVFKEGNIDFTRSGGAYSIDMLSYSNDFTSLAYIFDDVLVKYTPTICEGIEVGIRETTQNNYELYLDNSKQEFLNYTGWTVYRDSVKTGWENTIDTIVYTQTYGSFSGESVLDSPLDGFNSFVYHGLIFDYDLGEKSCFYDYEPTGIITQTDELINSISVFPNPTTGLIYLSESKLYEVFDVLGALISTGEGLVIDLSSANEGVYFVKVDDQTIKVIRN